MTVLYPNVVTVVLSFLPLLDVIHAAQTCRAWCEGALLVRDLDAGVVQRTDNMRASRFRRICTRLTVSDRLPTGMGHLKEITVDCMKYTLNMDALPELPFLHTLCLRIPLEMELILFMPLVACTSLRTLTLELYINTWQPTQEQIQALHLMHCIETLHIALQYTRAPIYGYMLDNDVVALYAPPSLFRAHLKAGIMISKDYPEFHTLIIGDLHICVRSWVLPDFVQPVYAHRIRSIYFFTTCSRDDEYIRAVCALLPHVHSLSISSDAHTNDLSVIDIPLLYDKITTLQLTDFFALTGEIARLENFRVLEHLVLDDAFRKKAQTEVLERVRVGSPKWPSLCSVENFCSEYF